MRRMRNWQAGIAFLAAFVALDWVSFFHPMSGLDITPWNPQAALAVAFLLRSRRGVWLVWLAILCADRLVRTNSGVLESLLSAAIQTAGYFLVAAGLARWVGVSLKLSTRAELVRFLAVIAVGALVSAALHVAGLLLFGFPQPSRVPIAIYRAWIGDGVGLVVMLPILLLLTDPQRRRTVTAMARVAEFWAVALLGCAGTFAVFAQPVEEQFKYFYVLFLPVAWAATRFGITGAMCIAALVQLLLAGAVQSARYRPLTVFELQVLMAALAATGLLLGTISEEREEAGRKLRLTLRLAAAGEMASALAHELNQPLAALTSYARALQLIVQRLDARTRENTPLLDEVSGKLVAEAARASEVVRRLRNFFREQATTLASADIGAIVTDVVAAHEDAARASGVQLRCELAEALPQLSLDAIQISVVLRNLVANALEAAAEQAGEQPAHVDVQVRGGEEEVIVQVVDSGPGLAGTDLRAVFEERRSDKPGGMGVGLSISRAIIEAHGGRLWAEPGPGGRFFFSLPAIRSFT